MNVDEFLSDLYNDELSDMFIGNRNSREEPRAKLLPLINRAMNQAYAKYQIAFDTEELVVTEEEDTYTLEAENVLQVVAVTNAYGRELTADEVYILDTVLVFPDPMAVTLEVAFKTKPVRFTEAQVDEDTDIVLPELLLPWMSSWVAARIFLAKKGDENQAKGASLLALASLYEQAYQDTNTTNEYTRTNSAKLTARGFG